MTENDVDQPVLIVCICGDSYIGGLDDYGVCSNCQDKMVEEVKQDIERQ